MKVLHISGARSWGGNEQQLVDVIPELEKLNVTNFVLGIKESPLDLYFREKETIFLYSKERKINKLSNLKFLNQVTEEHQPDIIHLHTSDAVTLFVLTDLLYRLKIPAILSKKGIGNSMSLLSVYKYNYRNLKKIICVSEAVKRDLQQKIIKKKHHDRLVVVYDGVNLDRTIVKRTEKIRELFGIKEDVRVLGNIANHSKAKDLGILIKMMDYIVHTLSIKDVHLVQIGEFSGLTDELKSEIHDRDLEAYVTLAGFQKNALDFIPQFDIYVMSSEREGLPITIFESFFKKTPVVSTKAGGIPEAIVDGENGFLAEVKDFRKLAEKVTELLENKELQELFVKRSERIFHDRFLSGVTAKNTCEIYKKVLTE